MNPRTLFLLLLLALAPTLRADAFDDKILGILKARNTAGCAIAYAEKGKVKFAKGYGFANLEHNIKMRPDHLHELASVSKQFTAVSILQLAQAGKLSIEDPIRKFFPDAGEKWDTVKVRHLLQHSGGLPDYLNAITSVSEEVTSRQMVDSIKNLPLRFDAGLKFEYSNSGYMVLGQIVEKVSKQTMGDYLYEHLFKPAGMKTAVLNDTLPVIPNRADGYSIRSGKIVREGYTSSSLSKTGDGQIMASTLDLVAWDTALRGDALLNEASRKLMLTRPSFAPAGAGYYGFGVTVLKDGEKVVQHHGGSWMGTSTFLVRYLDEGKCLVILCNSDGGPTSELLAACEERFLGRKVVSNVRR